MKLKKSYTVDEENVVKLKDTANKTSASSSAILNECLRKGLEKIEKLEYNFNEFKRGE